MADDANTQGDSRAPRSERITLTDNVDGVRVSDTLIAPISVARAAAIYARNMLGRPNADITYAESVNLENASVGSSILGRVLGHQNDNPYREIRAEQIAAPPEEYVVRYYVWDDASKPKPEHTVEEITSTQPVSPDMREQAQAAFATIESQLPGRFRFVPVTDPKEADISLAAVSDMENAAGIASTHNGAIILDAMDFEEDEVTDHLYSRQTVLHEILHALGLRHPFEDVAAKPDTNLATYYDSVMTYDRNNKMWGGPKPLPTSLMPSDIDALIRLYPIKADARAAMVGVAAHAQRNPEVGAVLEGKLTHDVLLPNAGIVYQPAADTDRDIVTLRNEGNRRAILKGAPNGMFLSDGLHTTYMQVIPEEIRTSAGSDGIRTKRDVNLYVEENRSPEVEDYFYLDGNVNRVSLPAHNNENTKIEFTNESHSNEVFIRNRGVEEISLPRSILAGASIKDIDTLIWTKNSHDAYVILMANSITGQSQSFTIQLEEASPKAVAILEARLNQMETFLVRPREAIEQQRMREDPNYQLLQMFPGLRDAYENRQAIQSILGQDNGSVQDIPKSELGTFAPQADATAANKDAYRVSVPKTQR